MENIKIKGLKKTVGDHNNNRMLARRIYLDRENGEVWCDVFPSLQSWNVYKDKAITEVLATQNAPFDHDFKISMEELREMCEEKIKEWPNDLSMEIEMVR